MNFWYYFWYHIYTGIALGGLCAGRAIDLTENLHGKGDDQYVVDCADRRRDALKNIIETAQIIGDDMAAVVINSVNDNAKSVILTQFRQPQTPCDTTSSQ